MPSQNVNVSAQPNLALFAKYLFYLVLFLVGVYILLNAAVQVGASFLSYRQIDRLLKPFTPAVAEVPFGAYTPQMQKLEALKNRFFLEDGFSGQEFTLKLHNSPQVNAFLTTGKEIFFTQKLLEEIKDEDVLFFILAHEIGHYKNKDLFRAMARSILFALVDSLLDQRVSGATSQTMTLHYSRANELEADCFAARKLQDVYGTAEGGRKFFNYLAQKEPQPEWTQYLHTHPGYAKRIDNLSRCTAQ